MTRLNFSPRDLIEHIERTPQHTIFRYCYTTTHWHGVKTGFGLPGGNDIYDFLNLAMISAVEGSTVTTHTVERAVIPYGKQRLLMGDYNTGYAVVKGSILETSLTPERAGAKLRELELVSGMLDSLHVFGMWYDLKMDVPEKLRSKLHLDIDSPTPALEAFKQIWEHFKKHPEKNVPLPLNQDLHDQVGRLYGKLQTLDSFYDSTSPKILECENHADFISAFRKGFFNPFNIKCIKET